MMIYIYLLCGTLTYRYILLQRRADPECRKGRKFPHKTSSTYYQEIKIVVEKLAKVEVFLHLCIGLLSFEKISVPKSPSGPLCLALCYKKF